MFPLFVKKLIFNRDEVEDFDVYPFNIPLINSLNTVEFEKPVTFIAGRKRIWQVDYYRGTRFEYGLVRRGRFA